MGKRRLRPAIEIISDIGSLGYDLQHHAEPDIAAAMTFIRQANPEMFDWLAKVLDVTKKCRHCGVDLKRFDSDWLDRETHLTCATGPNRAKFHEPT